MSVLRCAGALLALPMVAGCGRAAFYTPPEPSYEAARVDRLERWAGSPLARRGVVLLFGDMHELSAGAVCARLRHCDADPGVPRIALLVDTPGGFTQAYREIAGCMRGLSKPVDVVAVGNCMSAGAAVMQAATGRRLAMPGTWFMVHRGQGPDAGDLRAWSEQEGRLYEQLLRTRSSLPEAWFPLDDTTRFFDADDALRYGFIDAVVERVPIPDAR